MTAYRPADTLLHELGISRPGDIDIEAIAYYCGARVQYISLDDCAARIIGVGDKAVISVDANETHRGRQRFSAAHEVGHWMQDRGQALFCQARDLSQPWDQGGGLNREAMANRYAADLLLPAFLFRPAARDRPMTFESVFELADEFKTSYTATALRLVEYGSLPAMIISYSKTKGRGWFRRGPDVPNEIWPSEELPHETQAFALLYGDEPYTGPVTADARDWITHRHAHRYTVIEHAIKTSEDTVLVLLWWKDESQLMDLT